MRRRAFITLLGTAIGWPLAARAQPAKLPTIGFLGPLTSSAMSQWTEAFVQRLRELGWIEGRTVAIEYRWGEGRSERFPEIVAEFVQLKVSVIVTGGTAAVIAAKQATSVIPIVFGSVADPVGTGLVASLARPGGNVTGLSNQSADLPRKRLELWREVVPGLCRLAIMANINNPSNVLEPTPAICANSLRSSPSRAQSVAGRPIEPRTDRARPMLKASRTAPRSPRSPSCPRITLMCDLAPRLRGVFLFRWAFATSAVLARGVAHALCPANA
jgi:hypothetical protein